MTWRTIARDMRKRTGEDESGAEKSSEAYIEAVSPTEERVVVDGYGQGKVADVLHPYRSTLSWVRVMPEPGTYVETSVRGDTGDVQIDRYKAPHSKKRTENYENRLSHYRTLKPGEGEITSPGLAQLFWSQGGTLNVRGGATFGWLSNEDLEIGWKAPTHTRILHDHQTGKLLSSERFGVVVRTGDTLADRVYPRTNGAFSREYSRVLAGGSSPAILSSLQEGDVLDDNGDPVLSPIQTKLRMIHSWYDKSDLPAFIKMDELTNTWIVLTDEATTGLTLQIPKGSVRFEIGEDLRMAARQVVELSGDMVTIYASSILNLKAPKAINIESAGAIALLSNNISINGRTVVPSNDPI